MINRILLTTILAQMAVSALPVSAQQTPTSLKGEKLAGKNVWLMPILAQRAGERPIPIKIWFEDQFLGDGKAYERRAGEFAAWKRTDLRAAVVETLKRINNESFEAAKKELDELAGEDKISGVRPHWIVNGFSCLATKEGIEELQKVTGVRAIFADMHAGRLRRRDRPAKFFAKSETTDFDPQRYKHPWYSRYLLADRVWEEFKITGEGTLNVIHDGNFIFSSNITGRLYQHPGEIPGNGKDDDGNGYVDDCHGYNFDAESANLTPVPPRANTPLPLLHGMMCATIICGEGQKDAPFEFGIAPRSRWAGVIGLSRLESAVEWAIEQKADTYSMSFSIPGLGHYRSYWRKLMEHGSFCGLYFVSGAGNFGQRGTPSFAPTPLQMRTPEDIPEVVFAAAGVQRDFSRTPFSSTGPVMWELEHYRDGLVKKPEVCAFNMNLPRQLPDGRTAVGGASGNSFAGPMFCGAIDLMLSADPELLPWDLKQIITSTAMDVAEPGYDAQTGHGLINCYRAVKEVLRRKAIREKSDATRYAGRTKNDTLNMEEIKKKLAASRLVVSGLAAQGQAAKLGLKVGDVIRQYNGTPIANRLQLQRAKRQATLKKVDPVVVAVEREGKLLEFKFTSGQLGFAPELVFDDPVFK